MAHRRDLDEPQASGAARSTPCRTVGYLASRFPEVTQTWMLRELDGVMADPGTSCELMSLFPPKRRTGVLHPSAERWSQQLRRPDPLTALRDLGWWTRRAPRAVLATAALVVAGHVRQPRVLLRALVTLPLAAAHARTVEERGIDHLHAHTATYPTLAAWVCRRLTGVSYSFTAHAHDLFVDQSLLRRKVADAAFVVAVSDHGRGFLAAYGGDRATPVHVVRCGVDLELYRFRPRVLPAEGPLRALAVGGLKDYKGHRYLLEALASDRPRIARIGLDLVGDGPERPALEALARQLGLEQRVRFHGALREPAVRALLERADLFVLPSVVTPDGTTEGLPVVVVEALATGVPVVATRVAAVPEVVHDGETGLVAEPASATDLRRAVEALVADPEAARCRAEAGRRLVERRHDAVRSAATMARLFHGERPAGARLQVPA